MAHRVRKFLNKLTQCLEQLQRRLKDSLTRNQGPSVDRDFVYFLNFLTTSFPLENPLSPRKCFQVSFAAAGTQCTLFSIRYMQMRAFENRAKFQNMNRGKRPSCPSQSADQDSAETKHSRLTVPAPLSWMDVGTHGAAMGSGQWSGTASAG